MSEPEEKQIMQTENIPTNDPENKPENTRIENQLESQIEAHVDTSQVQESQIETHVDTSEVKPQSHPEVITESNNENTSNLHVEQKPEEVKTQVKVETPKVYPKLS